MLKRVLIAILVTIAASSGFVLAPAHAAPDHLSCYHVRDPLHRNTFSTVLLGDFGTQTCVVKAPAKLACVQVDETNTIPAPPGGPTSSPAGSFFCYQLKCRRPLPPTTRLRDQFGARTVKFGRAQMLCTPASAPSATTSTTIPGGSTSTTMAGGSMTTTTLANGQCTFSNGQCTGRCGSGMKCGAAASDASCACRQVACGDADAPACKGACSSSSDACVPTSLTGCSCVSIPG
jgi:hypothetical protein